MLSLCFVLPIFVACEHQHSFVADWTKDETHHYHLCACGAQMDIGIHQYDEGKVRTKATCKAVGEMVYTCIVCGYEKSQDITILDHNWVKSYDQTYHYEQCSACGEKKEIRLHSFILIKAANNHEWRCNCGCVYLTEKHIFKLDVSTGEEVCTICGYKNGDIIMPEV